MENEGNTVEAAQEGRLISNPPPKKVRRESKDEEIKSHNLGEPQNVTNTINPLVGLRFPFHVSLTCRHRLETIRYMNAKRENTRDPKVGVMLRRRIPSRNSCLFDSFHYILQTGEPGGGNIPDLRSILAVQVTQNQLKYHAKFLGMPNALYSQYILNPKHWGGILELHLLSEHYKLQIVVFNLAIPGFCHIGKSYSCTSRSFMVFNGIHFNPLYFKRGDFIQTMFPIDDSEAMDMAMEVAKKAKSPRNVIKGYEHHNLKCNECQAMLLGDIDARKHALETFHTDIGLV